MDGEVSSTEPHAVMKQPGFSVIVPIHNRAHLIGECIRSILAQTYTDFELILVDNNSTDDLAAALAPFRDERIILTDCKIQGPSAARMKGISVSRGIHLSFLDSDDLWRDDVLQSVHHEINSDLKPQAVYIAPHRFKSGKALPWDNKTGKTDKTYENFLEAMLAGAPGTGGLAGARKDLFGGDSGFDENIWIGEDLDWAMKNASVGPVRLLQAKPRLAYRRHEGNLTNNNARYIKWASELLTFSKNGRYDTRDNPLLRSFLFNHMIVQLRTLLHMREWGALARICPQTFLLGLRWGVLRPRLFLDFTKAVFSKLIGRAPASFALIAPHINA